MMTLKRFLFLHDQNVLGWPDGRGTFYLHHEFWGQVCSIVFAATELEIGNVLSDEESAVVADLIEGKMNEESWQIHLALWGDSRGRVVRELIEFLRGGGLVVVDSAI